MEPDFDPLVHLFYALCGLCVVLTIALLLVVFL